MKIIHSCDAKDFRGICLLQVHELSTPAHLEVNENLASLENLLTFPESIFIKALP